MTEMFKYNEIKNEHGPEILKKVRNYEKISKINGRYISHLRFFLQCKHSDIIPKSIKIKSQINTAEARKRDGRNIASCHDTLV